MDEIQLVHYRKGKIYRRSEIYQTTPLFWARLLKVLAGQEIEIQDRIKKKRG